MSMNLGLNLVEVDGRATPSIQGAATSVAGFVIRSRRGVPGAVVPVTNWTEFKDRFGDYQSGAYGAYAIRGFFDNGGTLAYVTRVVNVKDPPVATAASIDLAGEGAAAAAVLTLTAGFRGQPDPGAWGNDLSVCVTNNTTEKDVALFDLQIKLGDKLVETWEKLKIDGTGKQAPAWLNDPSSGSRFVTATVASGAKSNPAPTVEIKDGKTIPKFEKVADGKKGADDNLSGAALDGALIQALKERFDTFQIQLLCCPESADLTVATAGWDYCSGRGDCLFVGHVGSDEKFDVAAAQGYLTGLRNERGYGAFYFPWIRIADPASNPPGLLKWIPPTGHILGVYARTERERGIWKAPAGNGAQLAGALDVSQKFTDTTHTNLVKNGAINAVRFVPGVGVAIDSSRTVASNMLWQYVNVRLLFNYVKSSLKSGLRWVVQEPNDAALWNKIKFNSVTPFLMGLWRRGAFGSGAPADVFTVKVDAENNRPEDIKNGICNIEVYFYPSRPAETIVITVGQQEGGGKAGEG